MMNSSELPLFGLFLEWQQFDTDQKHQALDMETYFRLLEAVNHGIGLWSHDQLFALCCVLLVKPHHLKPPYSLKDFKEKFDSYLESLQKNVGQPIVGSKNPVSSDDLNKVLTHPIIENTAAERINEKVNSNPNPPREMLKSNKKKDEPTTGLNENPMYLRFGIDTADHVAEGTYNLEEPKTKFHFQIHYLPIDNRSIQQNMRSLRQQNFRQQQLVFDLDSTLNNIARYGYLDRLTLKRVWTNKVPLVLLLDQQGSMVAFHAFCDELKRVAKKTAERQPEGQTGVYYFWNCPTHQLFRTPQLTDPVNLNEWKRLHIDSQVIILSDAGAARGYYSEERLGRTKWFLNQLPPRNVVWLNPMPRKRWKGSSAIRIAEWVKMFTIDNFEFNNAFKYLKKLT